MSEPARLERVETDIEKAHKYRVRMAEALKEPCKIMTDAKRDGITMSFNLATDAMGNTFIASLTTTKELKD